MIFTIKPITMKINDLKRYKPLDITEISGSPWNTAEKVLGLDNSDKVVMAEPEENVTPEYVESAITEAMEAETARTESTYLKEGDLADYATKEYVDEAISGVTVDLSDYYTKEETDAEISGATDDMATKTWVSEQGYLTEHQDLSAYAKTTAVTQDIQNAIASETARTEDVYAKKADVPDMTNYYTKSETDEAIAEAVSGISLDGYWTSGETKEYVDAAITGATDDLPTKAWVTGDTASRIETAIATETARTENTYAKPSDIPSLTGYATEGYVDASVTAATASTTGWVENQGYLTEHQDISGKLDTSVFTAYTGTTETEIGNKLDTTAFTQAMAAETARTEDTYLKKGEVPSLDGYWTSAQTESAITAAIETETGRTESTYVKSSLYSDGGVNYHYSVTDIHKSVYNNSIEDEIISYDALGYYMVVPGTNARGAGNSAIIKKINGESIIEDLSYSGSENIELPTFSDVSTAITSAIETETGRTESTYAKIGDIPSLTDYWTSAQTEAAITAATDGLATEAYVDSSITAATATETARTETTYAKIGDIPSLSGYWTSAETQNAITAATDDMATKTWVGEQGYLTEHQDISGKLDVSVFTGYTGTTDTTISGKLDASDFNTYTGATETALSGKVDTSAYTAYTASTDTAISAKVDESVFTAYTGTTDTALAGKVDTSAYTAYTASTDTALSGKVDVSVYSAYTGSTATALAGKQETLVSGTNIKTINNESILGEGNITIQGGGGGGGETVIELTKAQYEALDPGPAADTTYIITDADTVDLNDYAPASGLTELSGTVETLSSTKADAANVTARSTNWIPGWNKQGIITGGTQIYTGNINVNGTPMTIYQYSSGNLGTIYAPTSAGTAGQPLLSNGSGAPVWGTYKFAFISQSQYDAITTKDSTTIYFIVDPN